MRTVGCCSTSEGGAAARSGRGKSSAFSFDAPSSKTRIAPRRGTTMQQPPSAALSPSVPPSARTPMLAMPSSRSPQLSNVVAKAKSSRRASDEEPYPFVESEFVRVIPAVVARSSRDPTRGIVVFAQITDADADDPSEGVSGVGARGDGATLHDGAQALSMEIGGDGLLALLLMGARSAAQSARRERRAEARKERQRLRELERRRRQQQRESRNKVGFGGFFGASQRLFDDGNEEDEEGESSEDLEDSEEEGEGGENAAADEHDDDDDESSIVPPLALDLLWKVLSRGRRLSRREWSLVRVAVVDVDPRSGAFVARLFFGGKGLPGSKNSSEPVVAWETRARPSEAAWLAHRFDAPLFVRRDIFAARSSPLGELLKEVDAALDAMGGTSSDEEDADSEDEDESDDDSEDEEESDEEEESDDGEFEEINLADDGLDGNEIEDSLSAEQLEEEIEQRMLQRERRERQQRRQRRLRRRGKKLAAAAPVPFSSMSTPLPALAILAPGDPAPVVLLKRQLAVALFEEDYSSASAIRDHPLLAAYNRADEAEAKGDAPAAAAAAADLARLLRAGEEREALAAAAEEAAEEETEEEKKQEKNNAASPRAAASAGRGAAGRTSAARGGGRGGGRGGSGGRGISSAAAKRPPSPPPPAEDESDSNTL